MNRLSKFLAILTLLVVSIAFFRSVIVANAADPRAGVNIDPLNPAARPTVAQLQAAGVKWVRFVQKSDSYDYKSLIQSYSNGGIKTILVLNQETLWPPSGNGSFDTTYMQNFANKAKTMAQRYGNTVTAYEIWNEEDASSPASIFVPASNYKLLFKKTYESIKSANSSRQVLIGGLVSGNTGYLDQLKEGTTLLADGVAVHPYSTDPAAIVTTLENYQAHAAGKPIWVTEFGWETTQNNGQTQANFLGAVYSAIYTSSKLSSIPAVLWFGWSDAMGGKEFGLLTKSGVAKPSLTAFLVYASKIAAASDQAALAKAIAQIQLASSPPGSTGGTGSTAGGTSTASKIGLFVHGDFGNFTPQIMAAKPKVLKVMIDGGNAAQKINEARTFKQQNPNGITILRFFEGNRGDISQMDPTQAADQVFGEYAGAIKGQDLSAIDYFETPNESERINHWGSHENDDAKARAEVAWQNTFWSRLIDRNYNELNKLKTCAASLTPGYLKPQHVPVLKTMFDKLRQTGGTLCYHAYADDDILSTDKSTNTFWYENFYSSSEFNGVNVLLSEIGISDGWKPRANGRGDMKNFLMTVDCKIAKDPRVLGTAIYEIGTGASGVYSINDADLAGWLASYLKNPSAYNAGVAACNGVVIAPDLPGDDPTGGTTGAACNPVGDGTIAVLGPSCGPSDPSNPTNPKEHPDINVKLRGFQPENTSDQKLVDYRGSFGLDVDPKSPNVNELFRANQYHAVINSYRVGNWEGTGWAQDPWLNATAFQVNAGDKLYVPDSGYEIGCGYEVMVLYADDDSIFIKYTLEDNAIAGYGIHLIGIKPTAKIKETYDKMNLAGRKNLPALKPHEELGTAINNAVLVVYRDTGAFLDPRSCIDHWPGCPADGYPDAPAPSVSREEANALFSSPGGTYNQRSNKRIGHSPACDVRSLENYPIYPPLGSLQACPPEFPTVGEINTPKPPGPTTPPATSGCSIQPIPEPAYCTSAIAACQNKNDEKNGDICPNGIREKCTPASCDMLEKAGFTCGETTTNPDGSCNDVNGRAHATHNQCGIFIRKGCDGEGYDPNKPPEDDANLALFKTWQAAQSCYRGDSTVDYASLAPNTKDTIGRCLTYYAQKGMSKTGPPPVTINQNFVEQNLRLPSCVPTKAINSDRCTSSCGDPITLSEHLGFTVDKTCSTGQCKATIKLDPETPLYVPFARKLADYFTGTLDSGAVAEGTITIEELEKIREELKAGNKDAINTMFAKSGVAKKLLPGIVQDQLKCQFVNYVKAKDLVWGKTDGTAENTKYIFLLNGVKTIFKIGDIPITEIKPPPSLDPLTCKQVVYLDSTKRDWQKTPSGLAWIDVPLFDNEESQSKIEFAGTGVFTNTVNPIQTSVPEIRRLYNATAVIQRALIPDYDLTAIAQPVNPSPQGVPTPQALKLTVGPALNPGETLVACKPNPTPTLEDVFGEYDNKPINPRYALEPKTISSYTIGVDCVQTGAPQDPTSTSKVCTVGPEGQLNCFQQLPSSENTITKDFRVVAQTRNVTPYLYDIFLQTIDKSGGLLRIFKPSGTLDEAGYQPNPQDEFQQYYQPYPAESNKVKYQMPTTQGVQLDTSGNAGGWKLLFDKLGGVWTAQQFVLKLLQPEGTNQENSSTPEVPNP